MQNFVKFITLFILLAAFAIIPAAAQQPSSPLEKSCDPQLQRGLEYCLTALNLDTAAARKSLSIALVDITDPLAPRHAYNNPMK